MYVGGIGRVLAEGVLMSVAGVPKQNKMMHARVTQGLSGKLLQIAIQPHKDKHASGNLSFERRLVLHAVRGKHPSSKCPLRVRQHVLGTNGPNLRIRAAKLYTNPSFPLINAIGSVNISESTFFCELNHHVANKN